MKKKKRKKNTRNEFTLVYTLNLLHVILLRGFPKRSLFKRAKVFSFEEKEKNLKGHPERKSKEREKKIGSGYLNSPCFFRGVASSAPPSFRNPKGPVALFLAALRQSRCGAKGVIRAN